MTGTSGSGALLTSQPNMAIHRNCVTVLYTGDRCVCMYTAAPMFAVGGVHNSPMGRYHTFFDTLRYHNYVRYSILDTYVENLVCLG